jgi:hypothetical protein
MACDSCVHSKRCKWLIGDRYGYQGDECDWIPSRYAPAQSPVATADVPVLPAKEECSHVELRGSERTEGR